MKKTFRYGYTTPFSLVAHKGAPFLVILWASPICAQTNLPTPEQAKLPPAEATSAAGKRQLTLTPAALSAEAALQVPVTLQARRMPLKELLAALQEQAGVTLNATAEFPVNNIRVTARFKAMPLSEVMNALSHLYSAHWLKTEAAYVLNPGNLTALSHKKSRAKGLTSNYMVLADYKLLQENHAALAAEVYDSVPEEKWKAIGGVPFSELPPDLQKRVRAVIEENAADAIIEQGHDEDKILAQEQNLEIRWGAIPAQVEGFNYNMQSRILGGYLQEHGPGWAVYSGDKFVSLLFPDFHGSMPFNSARQKRREPQNSTVRGRTQTKAP